MSAERLREAAKVLREKADAANDGPWEHGHEGLGGGEVIRGAGRVRIARVYVNESGYLGCENATYIAAMHPGVGLALADWLDGVARAAERKGLREFARGYKSALIAAEAILGGAS